MSDLTFQNLAQEVHSTNNYATNNDNNKIKKGKGRKGPGHWEVQSLRRVG